MTTLNRRASRLALCLLTLNACSDEAEEPAASEAPVTDPAEEVPDEVEAPPPPFRSRCLEVEMNGDAPVVLHRLAGDMVLHSELERAFEADGHATQTEVEQQPNGAVIRWTLIEKFEEERQSYRNGGFRQRIAELASGVSPQEGFENPQYRTFEVRAPTRDEREFLYTVVNTQQEGRASRVSTRCIDHAHPGPLTFSAFAEWGWLPAELAAAESLAEGVVRTASVGPEGVALVLEGLDISDVGALEGVSIRRIEAGLELSLPPTNELPTDEPEPIAN